MNLLHRYILRNVFMSCLASVAMFGFLILALSVVKDMLSLLAEGQLTFRAFFRLIWMLLPFVFVYALPMGFITGALLVMGRLSAESEITSLRAAGVSIFRMSSSVFTLAILGTAISLIVNFYYGPLAKTNYRNELRNTIQTNPLGFIVERTFVRDFPGTIIYVGSKQGELLRDIWIWDLDSQGRAEKFSRAEEGRFRFHANSSDLELHTKNVAIEIRDEEDPENFRTRRYVPIYIGETVFTFSLERILGKETVQRKLSWMTFNELRAYMNNERLAASLEEGAGQKEAQLNLLKAKMIFHKNFAMGFAVLSFACIAIPLGVKTSRKETSANLGLGIGLGLIYYLAMISIDWLDGRPELRPELLFWLPNLAFQSYGGWMFFRADHGRRSKTAAAYLSSPAPARAQVKRRRQRR